MTHPSFLPDADAAVAQLAEVGLQGMEVFYKNYTENEIARFGALAEAHGLFPLGGSDYHGIHDDEREIGDIPLADDIIDAFLAFAAHAWDSFDAGAK